MYCLMDFLALIEQSSMSLTRTGQERLEQLAYPTQKDRKEANVKAREELRDTDASPVQCCPEPTAS